MTMQPLGRNHAGADYVSHVVKSFSDDYMTNKKGEGKSREQKTGGENVGHVSHVAIDF